MLKVFAVVVGMVLSGCLFSGESDSSAFKLKPGVYRSDYGVGGIAQQHESELVLGANGDFRFFQINDTTPWIITQGKWSYQNGMLIERSAVTRQAHYSYVFNEWQTVPLDTSFVRSLPDGFEHLEISQDTGYDFEVVRWVQYHKVTPVPGLPYGHYQFSETYPDAYDSTHTHSGLYYLHLNPDSTYSDGRLEDGIPLWEFESNHWFVSGSHLIVKGGRTRDWDDTGFTPWVPSDTDAEYVVHIRTVTPDSFQQWVPVDQSFQYYQHWITLRHMPN